MSKVFNYRTGKLYESEGIYKVKIFTSSLSPDVVVNGNEYENFGNSFVSYEEARDAINAMIEDRCEAEGISMEDIEVVDTDSGSIVTIPGYKEWEFVITGGVTERLHESYRNKSYRKIYEENFGEMSDRDVYSRMDIVREKRSKLNLEMILECIESKCPDLYNYLADKEFNFFSDSEMDGELVKDMGDFIMVNKDRMCGNYNDINEICDEFIDALGYGTACESVSSRFSRLRSIYEASDDNDGEDNDKNNDDEDNDSDDEKGGDDEEGGDDEDDKKGDDEDGDGDDDEEAELKAVLVTVYKKDKDKFKDELVDAGISEDDIEILEDDDDDEDDDEATVDFRIDAGSILELKDYLEKKGIDLEEKIGGEIVDDDEDGDDKDGEEGEGKEGGDEEGGDDENEIDNLDFGDLGDIFGGDNSGEEK